MSTQPPPTGPDAGREPTEEELMAAYQEQLAGMPIEQLVVSAMSQLLQVGGMRAGLAPGTEAQRDPDQLRIAIEAVAALKPLVADALGPNVAQVDEALAQLQRAYAQIAGQPAGSGAQTVPTGPGAASAGAASTPPAPGAPGDADPGAAGPAQRSGRLWVPGQ